MTLDTGERWPGRTLAGATVLQAVPAMRDDPVGRAALDLAVGQLRAGARALVVGGGGALVGELQALGGEWVDLDFTAGTPFARRRSMRALEHLIRSHAVAVVHAHGAEAARTALAAAKAGPAALLTSYLDTPPAPGWGTPRGDAQARGHIVLACSAFAADWIAERHRIARERIVVVPRGIDTAWFDPYALEAERVAALRESWRLLPQVRVVLVPDAIDPSQGLLTLIDAVRMLASGGMRGVAFVIAGHGATDPATSAMLDERIAVQGLGGIVRRVGHCADMPAAYATADFVVLTTEQASTFSAMAAEAQAMARPVLAPQVGAMAEMMRAPPPGSEEPRSGWLVPPGDTRELARAIAVALALDPASLAAVGAQARAFAEGTFARQQVAAATLAAYEWLLRGHD